MELVNKWVRLLGDNLGYTFYAESCQNNAIVVVVVVFLIIIESLLFFVGFAVNVKKTPFISCNQEKLSALDHGYLI